MAIQKATNKDSQSHHLPICHIWCMQCGFEKVVRGRPMACPKCSNSLHEKRYLF